MLTRDELNALGAQILDACIEVHRHLGPGLLESVYVFALLKEFEIRGIKAVANTTLPLYYKGHNTGKYYEMDILIEGEIVFEAKAVEIMHPVFEAQMISYLKLSEKRLGYLVNFNVARLKDGFRRFVNNF
ncbi:MAG TPA: GxxExxY protein [Chitinophagaceae bacterium]|nr:GxxExxY protein [Chitinophagaceae bacterium]